MVAMAAGWSNDPVRPSKIPQSGPAADAESGVVSSVVAVAVSAMEAPLLRPLDSDDVV